MGAGPYGCGMLSSSEHVVNPKTRSASPGFMSPVVVGRGDSRPPVHLSDTSPRPAFPEMDTGKPEAGGIFAFECSPQGGGEPVGISVEFEKGAGQQDGQAGTPALAKTCLGQYRAIFTVDKLIGLFLGLLLFIVFLSVELADEYPLANDMLAVLGLIGSFWVFEVLPLAVTSLLPVVLLPFLEIMTSKAASSSYWGWVQMLFLGAFIVDIAIEQVNLHRRIALGFLLKVGVKYPWVVVLAFSTISYFMSMWCTNTATTVMLTPFATGLLDTAQASDASSDSPQKRESMRRYSVGILLAIAYSATSGGIATSIGTIPNGVLMGMPEVNNMVSAQDWFLFAAPVSLLSVLLAFLVVYLIFVRGVQLELNRDVLLAEYKALGPLNRDQVVVAVVQLLQIIGWLARKDLINNPSAIGIKGVNDATIACAAAAILFFVPSVKRPGETVLNWDIAQSHLPWGVLILMGGGFAIAQGFLDSQLTRFVGEQLAGAVGMSSFLLTYLITLILCFLTEVTSNTATANIMLPILASVATETLTHPLLLMLPATVACSFAFMLPAATPPNSVVFATKRIMIKDFVKAGFSLNLVMILLGGPLLYLTGSAVYDTSGPFPRWACLPATCRWVDVPGIVAGREVPGQACTLLVDGTCRLRDGTIFNYTTLEHN
mmetsp:Transcript_36783/g.102074  ORF Transcript_36783/g.102074 Transcript_36783/m.102074 type:complete len:658 (-) Transcript_36783:119-2092(-)